MGHSKTTLNAFQRWRKTLYISPRTLAEKSQYITTGQIDYFLVPDLGYYGFKNITLSQVPIYGEDNHISNFTNNGTYEIVPIAGCDCIKKATVNINVPVPEVGKVQNDRSFTARVNGNYAIYPTSGENYTSMSLVRVQVQVPNESNLKDKNR